jgi:hypothetical protein
LASVLAGVVLVNAVAQSPLSAQAEPATLRNLARLKLEALASLTNFVAWPAAAFRDVNAPITLCALLGDPLADHMERYEGRAGGRPVVGRIVEAISPSCHVLFVSADSPAPPTAVLEAVRGLSVLTVSDDMTFPDHGGMVGIAPKGNRVRLTINANAARLARLTVSSRLLSLASRQEPKVAP